MEKKETERQRGRRQELTQRPNRDSVTETETATATDTETDTHTRAHTVMNARRRHIHSSEAV